MSRYLVEKTKTTGQGWQSSNRYFENCGERSLGQFLSVSFLVAYYILPQYFGIRLPEFRDKLPGFEQVCHGLLQVLLVYISRKQNLSVISDSSFQLSKECALAKRYIDSNYSQNITLDSLAEITHINKFYLAHSFTECVGQSPINYLTDRRLEACKELLVSSNLSVAQVATSVGFSSQSYFSQIFRKKTGMTPRQYRSRYARKL